MTASGQKLKSERHHWWPECVSDYWKNDDGCVHWLRADGTEKTLPPKNCGVIGNGHHIKLSKKKDEGSVWDESFEHVFQAADSNFPKVIDWLKTLPSQDRRDAHGKDRFLGCPAPDSLIGHLVEGLVSLAVRSPMTRETGASLAEHFRGPLPERERNVLIGMNMRDMQKRIVENIGGRGKFVVIFSPDREFIFGDGFYHTITAGGNAPLYPVILAPITPEISVLYARPMQYGVEPKLSTIVFKAEEAESLNDMLQVYAKRSIFYRSEPPRIVEAFGKDQHLTYSVYDHPVDRFIHSIPGVPPRDNSLSEILMGLR